MLSNPPMLRQLWPPELLPPSCAIQLLPLSAVPVRAQTEEAGAQACKCAVWLSGQHCLWRTLRGFLLLLTVRAAVPVLQGAGENLERRIHWETVEQQPTAASAAPCLQHVTWCNRGLHARPSATPDAALRRVFSFCSPSDAS